ncbi:ABC transporter permease [Pseudoroseomonas deserti]|uniref:ABC transporter permease n=1 Tax=Teichococcus deserti TaxID=1817963 RepID=A0A1V2GZ55_9PROT|nr:ABC transporter permease subunit [Pseudoroseomonas deserti]ONG50137.1 ABC transporter permease [Pseudoroseomonas deserti]
MDYDWELLGFGPDGWGPVLLRAAGVTVAVSVTAFLLGVVLGTLCAWAKIGGNRPVRAAAEAYTVILRGIPDLLVIYLFYFGGRQVVAWAGGMLGLQGPFDISGFAAGAIAIGLISGAGQAEVFRGAYHAIPVGSLEAARVVGMRRFLMFRRIIAPQALSTAIPGLGNQWQSVIKESALVSVTGLVETMRQVTVAAGSTEMPFFFFAAGAVIYLIITSISGLVFKGAELWSQRGQAPARL